MTIIIIWFAFAVSVAGCARGSDAPDRGKRVVAGFYPLAYAAREIGGAGIHVTDLTPAGTEPHDLEISPRQVEQVRTADLVLVLGGGFQPQLERATSPRTTLRLLDTRGLARLPNGDPHVWLDPLRFGLIADRIGAALGREGASRRLVERLRALDGEYRSGLARCERRDIVTSHDAFAYLAQRYGLRQVAVTGLSPEAEPAPGDLQRVIDRVRRTGATTVFFEPLVSPRVAALVARETGTSTAVLDPIEGLTARQLRQGEDYFTLMRANLVNLRRALGCR